jgi:hypothetical protein
VHTSLEDDKLEISTSIVAFVAIKMLFHKKQPRGISITYKAEDTLND